MQGPCEFSAEGSLEQYCKDLSERSIPALIALPAPVTPIATHHAEPAREEMPATAGANTVEHSWDPQEAGRK